MGMLDWFKKAKDAAAKKKADDEEAERQKRAAQGQKNYESEQGKTGKDAWASLDE